MGRVLVASVCALFYAGLIAVCSNPEAWFAKQGEIYDDGRLLRQAFLEKAFPVEQACFTVWTLEGLEYWLQFEHEQARCKSALAHNPTLASFVAQLTRHKVRFHIVAPGTKLAGDGQIPVELGRGPFFTPAASFQMKDKWMVFMIRPAYGFGFLEPALMSDGKAAEIDGGILIVHEVLHVRSDWAPGVWGNPSNYWADQIENQLRKQRDPHAAQRLHHNPPTRAVPGLGPTE
jgi:hypothetical protein